MSRIRRESLSMSRATQPRIDAAAVAVAALLLVSTVPTAGAEDSAVPVELQVELLARIVRYERTYMARTDSARVLVVVRRASIDSARAGAEFMAHVRRQRELGGRAVQPSVHEFTTARALGDAAARDRIDIVYLAPGLGSEVPAIASAFAGRNVLTVAATGRDVDRGAVVGFELASSRPRIAINLSTARAQRLRFNAQFLRIARVVE
jgi:hypothetical protein